MAIYLGESTVMPIQTHQQGVSITKKISNYIFRFEDKIGQGNFSKVYKGFHQFTNEQVAIKIIELSSVKSTKLQELLFSEIEVIQSLNHPNILKCHQVLKSENNCYIITELCNGGDLQSVLKKQKCLNEISAGPYIREIFKGLLYLCQRGIVHRDIKIANIFLHNGICKIADFGFAKYTNNQNFYDLDIGSPLYMSPEGMIDHMYGMKTDVWAFGVIIFELLHGKTPFSYCSSQYELKRAVVTPISYHIMRPNLSPEIRNLILKCLVVDFLYRPDASNLKNDPFLYSLLYGMSREIPQLKKVESILINSMYSSVSLQTKQNPPEQYFKQQANTTHTNHPNTQSFHLQPVQSYGNLTSSAHYSSPQINQPVSSKPIQSPSQPQIHVPLQFSTNSPTRVMKHFGSMIMQQTTDIKKKQQQTQLGSSPNHGTYQPSHDKIQTNFQKQLIQQTNYSKNGNDRKFLRVDKIQKESSENYLNKMSNSSRSYDNLGKKVVPKTMSQQNITKFQNNLGIVNSQQKPKQELKTSINSKKPGSFQPSSLLQTPHKSQHSNSQHEGTKLSSQSFSGKTQTITPQKLNFKQESVNSPKKFGQLIKKQKRTDANIKSIIKVNRVQEPDSNQTMQRAKAKSHIKFDHNSTRNSTQSGINAHTFRGKIDDLSSCKNSQHKIQSLNQSPVRMPSFIHEKQKQKQELKKNVICTIIQFKEAVGFLHYCRLYYRFVAVLKKTLLFPQVKKYDFLSKFFKDYDQIVQVYWRYLITALSELIENIRCKQIIYDGESYKKKKLKEDKLREVTEEYFKKYMEEVNRNRAPHDKIFPMYIKSTSISFMKERNEQLWEALDKEYHNVVQLCRKTPEVGYNFLNNFRNLCYFGLRINEANAIIANCIHMKNYKLLGDAIMENWLAQEYYGEELYFKLKNQHYKKVNDTNALKNSETNDTQTENHSRAKYL